MPGLELNRRFFGEVVQPIIASTWPRLRYSAARLGPGSDVLGYDTPRSMDHDWGLQLKIFVNDRDQRALLRPFGKLLSTQLPVSFLGHSIHWSGPRRGDGTWVPLPWRKGPITHRIELHSPQTFFRNELGLDPFRLLTNVDWLLLPQQQLLHVTRGAVYHDGLGLAAVRRKLAFYPGPVWRYYLACQWARIGQEDHFPGRCAEAGDNLGSQLLTSRLVRDLMRLCFLMERTYVPYTKWFGTAFGRLRCARRMEPLLRHALEAPTWKRRERWLCAAYEQAARMHNALRLTPFVTPRVSSFHGRPWNVLNSNPADALLKSIRDPALRRIKTRIGAVDQFADSTDLNGHPELTRRLASLYRPTRRA